MDHPKLTVAQAVKTNGAHVLIHNILLPASPRMADVVQVLALLAKVLDLATAVANAPSGDYPRPSGPLVQDTDC